MPLQRGDELGPYEILAPIGAGCRGEAYKAATRDWIVIIVRPRRQRELSKKA